MFQGPLQLQVRSNTPSASRPNTALFCATLRYLVLGCCCSLFCSAVSAQDELTQPTAKTLQLKFKTDQDTRESLGEVVQEDSAGNLIFLTPDGQLWTLYAEDVISRDTSQEIMQPLSSEAIFDQFNAELPPGFEVLKTKHYVIVFNTSEAYAKWVGELFERLYRGFYNYWKRTHNWTLDEPRFPLVAVVFKDKNSYGMYAQREVGDAAQAMIGYYNMKTNRMVMYDLTGVNGVGGGRGVSNTRMINQLLSRPQAERTVATIVHEAVHQIAYNSGLQTRLADNPRWLSEGLAMYFESPDFSNRSGWSMGKVNLHNFQKFARNLSQRKPDSLTTLLSTDDRLLESTQAAIAYPESWALTYFLMKTKKKEFTAYMQELAELPAGGIQSARGRVEMFKKHFGSDLAKLDQTFLRYMRSVSLR